MSKMSQLHAELSEQASELGFKDIEEAFDNGYEVMSDGQNFAYLVETKTEEEKAHDDYIKRKEAVLADLEELRSGFVEGGYQDEIDALTRVIEFVKEGEK